VSPFGSLQDLERQPRQGESLAPARLTAGSSFAFADFQYSSAICRTKPLIRAQGVGLSDPGNHHNLLTLRHGTAVTVKIGSGRMSASDNSSPAGADHRLQAC